MNDSLNYIDFDFVITSLFRQEGKKGTRYGVTNPRIHRPPDAHPCMPGVPDDEVSISAEATGVMMGSSTVYASRENLYIAQSSFGWWDGISPIDRETRIHRVALDGARSRYESTGVVGGYLHNQFSMSEHNGMLRVATTFDDWWWGTDGDDDLTGGSGDDLLIGGEGSDTANFG